MPELDTDDIPHADSIAIGICKDPACSKLHLILFDENEKPMAVGSVEDTAKFIENIQHWAYIAATRKDF